MKRSVIKRKTPLRRQSTKRVVANRLYIVLRETFLSEVPHCQIGYENVCTKLATQVLK